MPYVPRIQTVSDHLIIDNVLAIVKRDMKNALDYFWAADALPDFTQRTVGRFFLLNYPTFAVDPDRSGPVQSADGSFVEDSFRVQMFFAVAGTDAPTVTRNAMKYTQALESILRNATVADYTTNVPANTIFGLTTEVSYEYGIIGKNATAGTYEKPVNMELLLKFNER